MDRGQGWSRDGFDVERCRFGDRRVHRVADHAGLFGVSNHNCIDGNVRPIQQFFSGNSENSSHMLRACQASDFETIYTIVNDAVMAYRGVIPPDCWHEPYMTRAELEQELASGVVFWGFEEAGGLVGVMGFQDKREAALIRHAYVRTQRRKQGIGTILLHHLEDLTTKPILIGTWANAVWAIRFYKKNGYRLVSAEEKGRLLKKHLMISNRQIKTSVVLASETWFAYRKP